MLGRLFQSFGVTKDEALSSNLLLFWHWFREKYWTDVLKMDKKKRGEVKNISPDCSLDLYNPGVLLLFTIWNICIFAFKTYWITSLIQLANIFKYTHLGSSCHLHLERSALAEGLAGGHQTRLYFQRLPFLLLDSCIAPAPGCKLSCSNLCEMCMNHNPFLWHQLLDLQKRFRLTTVVKI